MCDQPGRRLLATTSDDETLRVWDAATGTEQATLTGHMSGVEGCAVSPDGAWIVSASGTVRVWDVATGEVRARLVLPGGATSVAFFASAPAVACGRFGRERAPGPPGRPDIRPAGGHRHKSDGTLTARCPAHFVPFPITEDQLGKARTCPRNECGADLRLSAKPVQPLPKRPRRWFRRR